MEIVFVTGNRGKHEEVAHALAPLGIGLRQADLHPPEIQADALEAVARAKAEAVERHLPGTPFLVDDAGLFVEALGGFPGVYSAYALRTLGIPGLLRLLDGVEDRRARFEAVLALATPEEPLRLFKGVCRGRVALAPRSRGKGFGFDPVFIPEGHAESFAEMDLAEKNRISHRGRALTDLVDHLRAARAVA